MYDEAKRFAEALTMAYHRSRGLSVRIARIFNTYGPRMRRDDGRAVPAFIEQGLRGDPITVHGTGAQTRSLCYVDDLIEGLWRLLVSDTTGPGEPRQPRGGERAPARECGPVAHRGPVRDWCSSIAPSMIRSSDARISAWLATCSTGSRASPSRTV